MATRRVGSDEVEVHGESLLVRSAHDMPLWRASRHRKVVIIFEGRQYTVADRLRTIGDLWEYELEPYPDVLHELPSATIEYGEAFVRERDEVAQVARRRSLQARGLGPFVPLLGFFPAASKLRLGDRYGFDPRRLTEQSLWIEMIAIGVALAGIFVGFSGLLGSMFFVLLGTFVVLLPDVLIRRGHLQLDSAEQFGFYEWLFRRRLAPSRLSRPAPERPRLKPRPDGRGPR